LAPFQEYHDPSLPPRGADPHDLRRPLSYDLNITMLNDASILQPSTRTQVEFDLPSTPVVNATLAVAISAITSGYAVDLSAMTIWRALRWNDPQSSSRGWLW